MERVLSQSYQPVFIIKNLFYLKLFCPKVIFAFSPQQISDYFGNKKDL